MSDLRVRADEVSAAYTNHSRAVGRSTAFVKVALVLGGAGIIGIAQCATLPQSGPWPLWNVIGLIGTALAFFGGIAVVFTEPSAAKALEIARVTLEDARELQLETEQLDFYFDEVRRATELYGATMLMRTAVESLIAGENSDESVLAETLFAVSDRSLRLSLSFQASDHWTIGVYKIEPDSSGRVLKCISQLRCEKCDIVNARAWPEGRGAGWIAISNGNDVIVPDVKSPAMGTIFEGMLKPEDLDKYRSVAAVPIYVAGTAWGVVVATSDQEEHFSLDTRPGVRPIEGARALAGMLALALTSMKKN